MDASMVETFCILLAGGVLLGDVVMRKPIEAPRAAARGVAVIAMFAAAVGVVSYLQRTVPPAGSVTVQRVQAQLVRIAAVAPFAYVLLGYFGLLRAARAIALGGYVMSVLAGSHLMHEAMVAAGTALTPPQKVLAMAVQTIACACVGGVSGVTVVAALLGLVRSSKDLDGQVRTMARAFVTARLGVAVALPLIVVMAHPTPLLWQDQFVLVLLRYVGLLLSLGLFHLLCGRTGGLASGVATLSAVGVLWGEILALHLLRVVGVPF